MHHRNNSKHNPTYNNRNQRKETKFKNKELKNKRITLRKSHSSIEKFKPLPDNQRISTKDKLLAIFYASLLVSAQIIPPSVLRPKIKNKEKGEKISHNNGFFMNSHNSTDYNSYNNTPEPLQFNLSIFNCAFILAYIDIINNSSEQHNHDLHSVIQTESQPSQPCSSEWKERINSKMTVHNIIPENERNSINCKKITENICQTIQELPVSKETIVSVIENIPIVCSTNYHLTKKANENMQLGPYDVIGGAFNSYRQRLYLTPNDKPTVIHHECIHASLFKTHRTDNCFMPYDWAPLPVYSTEPFVELQAFANALNIGERRIHEFYKLLKEEEAGKKLITEKKNLLNTYKMAAKNCLSETFKELHPITYYSDLVTKGWNPNKSGKEVLIFSTKYNINMEMRIINAEVINNKTIVTVEPVDKNHSFLASFYRMFENLNSYPPDYGIQLAEKTAYTFDGLSKEAIEVFYPEANEMLKQDSKKCLKR